MASKIKVTYTDYENYCKIADELQYKCPKWPTKDDIRQKIFPNLECMLPFLTWVLETAPTPITAADKESKEILTAISKEYYTMVEYIPDARKNKAYGLPIQMTYDEYEEMCREAEKSKKVIRKWPTIEQVKRYGLQRFKAKLPWYILVLEKAPEPVTPEEKECRNYINALLRTNIQFTE